VKPTITAVVYDKRGMVIASAQNSYVKTHPIMAAAAKAAGTPERIYLHAEVAALLKCDWKKAHSMFISRYNKEGAPMPAAPCSCCAPFIRKAGVKYVYHT
jgi:deoxycytidylate deaminase